MTSTAHPYGGNGVSVADGIAAKEDWEWVANRWPDLRARLRPTNTGQSEVRTAPKSKPPIDLYISDLMFEITEKTRWYADELMREENWTPRTSSMPGLLREVAEYYGHWIIGTRETALEYCDWAHDYRHRVKRALERPAPPAYLGPCQQPECDGDTYVKPGQAIAHCLWCRKEYEVQERMEWIQTQLEARLMTRSELVSALHLLGTPKTMDTIKSWTRRKQLPEIAPGLYRLTDAMALAERTRGRPTIDKQ